MKYLGLAYLCAIALCATFGLWWAVLGLVLVPCLALPVIGFTCWALITRRGPYQ